MGMNAKCWEERNVKEEKRLRTTDRLLTDGPYLPGTYSALKRHSVCPAMDHARNRSCVSLDHLDLGTDVPCVMEVQIDLCP